MKDQFQPLTLVTCVKSQHPTTVSFPKSALKKKQIITLLLCLFCFTPENVLKMGCCYHVSELHNPAKSQNRCRKYNLGLRQPPNA